MLKNIHRLGLRVRGVAVDVILSIAALFAVTILPVLAAGWADVSGSGLSAHVALYGAVATISLGLAKTYRMIWRYVSFGDVVTLLEAVTLIVATFCLLEAIILPSDARVPPVLLTWTICVLWTANVGFLVLPRFIARIVSERFIRRNISFTNGQSDGRLPILLIGDAVRIEAFIRECERDPAERYKVVGVLSDDTRLHGSYLHGVRVIDSVKNLTSVLGRYVDRAVRPQTVVLAKDEVERPELARLLELTASAGIKLSRLPPSGIASSNGPLQPIKLTDLLSRPEIQIDTKAVAELVKDKCVFVTGAGGSIGSELSRQIASFRPSNLIILDFSEYNLYSIDKELDEKFPDVPRVATLADVRDGALISKWIGSYKPNVVFHAAALKHVPMMENHALEAIKTNVIGTINVAEACATHGVSAMVTISTDKAVNPTNIMGATKRLAEAYCQGLDLVSDTSYSTRYVTVRFGNVLGSAGSVVPLFQRQIEAGGPVTITHPEITRFFMTIPEAVSLVLQAGAQGLTMVEERGNIYLLNMGKPVKIIDLARQMIRLAGARPDVDIKITAIGLRPGEKLYEETIHTEESVLLTRNKAIMKLAPRATDLRIMRLQVQELKQACEIGDKEKAIRLLRISVPDYTPATELYGAIDLPRGIAN